MYILTDCSLSQVSGRQHDFKEVSLESRRENYQNESRKFEHSLVWRLVLFSLGITYVSLCKKQHISFHVISKVMARGYTRINWKGVEGQESYIRKTNVPYHYYNLLSVSFIICSRHQEGVSIARPSLLIPRACHAGYGRFLRVRHSLAERYRCIVVSIRFGEKWAFLQSSGNINFG